MKIEISLLASYILIHIKQYCQKLEYDKWSWSWLSSRQPRLKLPSWSIANISSIFLLLFLPLLQLFLLPHRFSICVTNLLLHKKFTSLRTIEQQITFQHPFWNRSSHNIINGKNIIIFHINMYIPLFTFYNIYYSNKKMYRLTCLTHNIFITVESYESTFLHCTETTSLHVKVLLILFKFDFIIIAKCLKISFVFSSPRKFFSYISPFHIHNNISIII